MIGGEPLGQIFEKIYRNHTDINRAGIIASVVV